jgi:hypothetical protein
MNTLLKLQNRVFNYRRKTKPFCNLRRGCMGGNHIAEFASGTRGGGDGEGGGAGSAAARAVAAGSAREAKPKSRREREQPDKGGSGRRR